MRILRRTITEDFEIDEAKTITEYGKEGTPHAEVREPEGPLEEQTLIEMFEWYVGSAYGDELFGNVDMNVGYEVIERADDE